METSKILCRNLRNMRVKFNLSQKQMGDFLNISEAAYNQFEKGSRSISVKYIERLALFYNIEEADFYEENPEKQDILTAFAFRAEGLTSTDMQSIARFRKIVSNYINMSLALRDDIEQ